MNNKLELYKAHDFCKSGTPKLTVIMVHGIASDSSSYDTALEVLENADSMADVRFVTFDLLGVGKSLASDELEYNYDEQLEALHNSIEALNITTPLILVGHSMGTMILSRYIDEYKPEIRKLVLISSPIYRKEEILHPAFAQAMEGFKQAVAQKHPAMLETKCFNNEIKNIVLDVDNYDYFAKLSVPTVIIFGEKDQIIAAHNIPGILKKNPNITAISTPSGHSVTADKAEKLLDVIEEEL